MPNNHLSFIRYKEFGKKEYAYEVISYWDKSIKKPRQKTRYLGIVVDKGKNIFEKPLKEKIRKEEQILDFGNSFLLHEFLEKYQTRSICPSHSGAIMMRR